MRQYSTEPRTRQYVKGYGLLSLFINKYKCDDILQNQEQENMLKDMDFCYLLGKIRNNYWMQDEMLPKSSP